MRVFHGSDQTRHEKGSCRLPGWVRRKVQESVVALSGVDYSWLGQRGSKDLY